MTVVSVEIDLGNRKESWTCGPGWGARRFKDPLTDTCLWLGNVSQK